MWSTRSRLTFLARAVVGDQDRLELLSNADRDHAGLSGGTEVRLDEVDLAVMPSGTQHRDMVPFGEGGHSLAESLTHPLDQRRRSNGWPH
jgi:hypothetical protein